MISFKRLQNILWSIQTIKNCCKKVFILCIYSSVENKITLIPSYRLKYFGSMQNLILMLHNFFRNFKVVYPALVSSKKVQRTHPAMQVSLFGLQYSIIFHK